MTTVFLCHSAVPSGAELSLLRSIRQHPSPETVTVVFAEDGPLVTRMTEAGAAVVVVPMTSSTSGVRRGAGAIRQLKAVVGLVGYARRLRPVLRQAQATVVVGRSLRAAIYGRLATWGLGCQFVWSVHDHLTSAYLGRAALFYAKVMPRLVDAVIVNSRSTLKTVSVTARRPVLVVPPGLDITSSEPNDVSTPLRTAVVLGRLSPWKGQDLAIRAFASSTLSDTATLEVIGSALFGERDYAESLRDVARECGVADRVRFIGQVDDPTSLLLTADVLVHASIIPEPFGAVVVEGMNAGCLVIATAPGGPAESVVDGLTGLLVAAGDVTSMSNAMDRLVTMPADEQAAMSSAARLAAQGFDSTLLSRELFTWLDSLETRTTATLLTVSSSLRA